MNRTTIIGKLGKDPEFQDRGNFKVVRLFLYYSRPVGKDPQGQTKFDFENFECEIQYSPNNPAHRVDETAQFMQLGLRKGDKLWVECTQKSSRGVDKQTQQEKVYKHLIVTDWEVLRADPTRQAQAPGYAQPPQYAAPAQPQQYAPPAAPGYPPQQQPQYEQPPAYTQPPASAPAYQPPPQAQPRQPQQPPYAPPAPPPAPVYAQPQQYGPPAPPVAGSAPVAPPPAAQFNGGSTAPF